MKLLYFLTEAFIAAFGITRPDPRQQRMVALVLGGFILLAGLGAVSLVAFFLWQMHSSAH